MMLPLKKAPGDEIAPPLAAVLSVSPLESDHAFLRGAFTDRAAWTQYTECKWAFHKSATIRSAMRILRMKQVQVILCERDIPGTWRELLAQITHLHRPPLLIVTSRLADDRLWSEALNLGAWDVLAKPFEAMEVIRTISVGCLHWVHRYRTPMKAAG